MSQFVMASTVQLIKAIPNLLSLPSWAVTVELIKALSSLAWPVLAWYIIWNFKESIGDLIPRLKNAEFFGQKFELNDSIETVKQAKHEIEDIEDQVSKDSSLPKDDEIKDSFSKASASNEFLGTTKALEEIVTFLQDGDKGDSLVVTALEILLKVEQSPIDELGKLCIKIENQASKIISYLKNDQRKYPNKQELKEVTTQASKALRNAYKNLSSQEDTDEKRVKILRLIAAGLRLLEQNQYIQARLRIN